MPPDEYAPSWAFGPPVPPSACCIVRPLTLVVPSAKTSYGAVPFPTKSALPKLLPSCVYCVHWPGEIPEAVVVAGGELTVGLAELEVAVAGVVVAVVGGGVVVGVVVVVAVAEEPSEKEAVRVRVWPERNSMPWESAAKTTKEPPSGTAKFTAMVLEALMTAASREGATPRTQKEVLLLVSQVPGALLSRRRPVTVRPPEALRVTVKVPSRAPSGARAVFSWPTRSRSRPL